MVDNKVENDEFSNFVRFMTTKNSMQSQIDVMVVEIAELREIFTKLEKDNVELKKKFARWFGG